MLKQRNTYNYKKFKVALSILNQESGDINVCFYNNEYFRNFAVILSPDRMLSVKIQTNWKSRVLPSAPINRSSYYLFKGGKLYLTPVLLAAITKLDKRSDLDNLLVGLIIKDKVKFYGKIDKILEYAKTEEERRASYTQNTP